MVKFTTIVIPWFFVFHTLCHLAAASNLQSSTNVKSHWKEKSLEVNNIMFMADFKWMCSPLTFERATEHFQKVLKHTSTVDDLKS